MQEISMAENHVISFMSYTREKPMIILIQIYNSIKK
jgi:hypothetical protein